MTETKTTEAIPLKKSNQLRSIGSVMILMLVAVANIIDVHVVGSGSALRGATVCFYLSNEGLSVLENTVHLGLPVPEKLKNALAQLHKGQTNSDDDQNTDE